MSTLTRERVQLHCRTCLCDLERNVDEIGLPRRWYHVMSTENLAVWIQNFTSLEVLATGQDYPQYICHLCYDRFKNFSDFQELVWTAAKKLDAVLLETNSSNEAASDEGIHDDNTAADHLNSFIKSEISCDEDGDNMNQFLTDDSVGSNARTESQEKYRAHNIELMSPNENGLKDFLATEDDEELFGGEVPKSCNTYKCEQCGRSFVYKYTYKAHIRQEHQGITNAFECEHCPKSYTKFCNLYRHMRQDHDTATRQFKCEYPHCKRSFRHLTTRHKHYQEFHQRMKRPPTPPTPPDSTLLLPELLLTVDLPPVTPKRFTCSLCNEQYETLYNLQNHMITHRDDMKFVCNICGKRKFTQMKLDEHYATVHDPKNAYPCNICHKVFKCKSHVSVHILSVHRGLRPYACHYCPMQFAAKNTLKIHERLHTGEKPFACEICGRRFTQLTPMKKHRLTHDRERVQLHQQQELMVALSSNSILGN